MMKSKTTSRKIKPLYSRDPEVLALAKQARRLKSDKKDIFQKIEDLHLQYEEYSHYIVLEGEDFMESLPLKSVGELQDFAAGHKKKFPTDIISEQFQLERDLNDTYQDLNKVLFNIAENHVDNLLAKIKCVIKKID